MKELFEFLTPSKSFFRALATALLVAFLIAQFPWMNNLIARLLNFPDLRHQISLGAADEFGLNLAKLEVVNLGFGKAEHVLVHVYAPDSNVLHYQVESQELYELKLVDLQNGIINISLDRLASGASIHIELVGTNFVTDTLFLSATSDQGSSIDIDSPSFLSQVDDYVTRVTTLFSKAGRIIGEASSVQKLRRWASSMPEVSESLLIIQSDEFQTVGLAALVIILLIVLFLPDGFVLVIPFMVGFVVWLFFDLAVSVVAAFLTFVAMAIVGAMSKKPTAAKGNSGSQATSQKAESARMIAAQYERKVAGLEQSLARKEDECRMLLNILQDLLQRGK